MSPTYKGGDWLCSWGNNHWFSRRATPDLWIAWKTFKCGIWNQASEMCRELQPHFTKEDFLQPRKEKNGPWANTTPHGFPTGIHCALLRSLLLSQWGLYAEIGVGYIIASKTETQMIDSWVWAQTCYMLVLVITSVPVFLHAHMLMNASLRANI